MLFYLGDFLNLAEIDRGRIVINDQTREVFASTNSVLSSAKEQAISWMVENNANLKRVCWFTYSIETIGGSPTPTVTIQVF